MLHVGSRAPAFELPDASMEMIQLSSFLGKKNVVLYFYPRDGSPVCTMEAINFSDHEDAFEDCDTVVFGVSRDDCLVHEEFRDKHGISLQLLSDADCEVMKKYDVLVEAGANSAAKTAIHRATFIKHNISLLINSEEIIKICLDKNLTSDFLKTNGFSSPTYC